MSVLRVGNTGEKLGGFLEVGHNRRGEVVINHGDLKPDKNGVGHIVFSTKQARHLAKLLIARAKFIDSEHRKALKRA